MQSHAIRKLACYSLAAFIAADVGCVGVSMYRDYLRPVHESFAIGIFLCIVLAYVGFIALSIVLSTWALFGKQQPSIRYPLALLLACLLWIFKMRVLYFVNSGSSLEVALFGSSFLAIQASIVPAAALSAKYLSKNVLPAEPRSKTRFQFTVKSLLFWVTGSAIVAATARFVLPQLGWAWESLSVSNIRDIIPIAAMAVLSVPIAWSAFSVTGLSGQACWIVTLIYFVTILITCLALGQDALGIICFFFVQIVLTYASLRLCLTAGIVTPMYQWKRHEPGKSIDHELAERRGDDWRDMNFP